MNPTNQTGGLLLEMVIVLMLVIILLPITLGSAKSINSFQCQQTADRVESFLEAARMRSESQNYQAIIKIQDNTLTEGPHSLQIPKWATIAYTSSREIKFSPGNSVSAATLRLNCKTRALKISVSVRPGGVTIK